MFAIFPTIQGELALDVERITEVRRAGSFSTVLTDGNERFAVKLSIDETVNFINSKKEK